MSSLDKMLKVLDLFDEGHMSVQLENAVKATGASRATVYRYIQSLCNCGLLASATGGRYVLGPRVIELDRLLRRTDPLLTGAGPLIREASIQLKTNIMLCSYYGDKVMCADLSWPDHSIAEIYERGRPMPMFRGAMAKIILAHLTPYQLRNIMLWHGNDIREAKLGENWDEFRSIMSKLRKNGYCVTKAEVFPGLVGVSAPVFDADQKVLGSVVFVVASGRYDRSPKEKFTEEIQELAKQITKTIIRSAKKDAKKPTTASRPRKVRASAASTHRSANK